MMDSENMRLREILKLVVAPKGHVKPMFDEYHVLKALLVIHMKEPIGRISLSKELGIGIASTRTLIRRLRELGLIEVDKVGGCYLTAKGRELVMQFLEKVKKVEDVSVVIGEDLKLAENAYGAIVKSLDIDSKTLSITELRDLFVRCGARAAIIAKVIRGRALLPPSSEVGEDMYPSLQRIRELLGAEEGDTIIVVFSDNKWLAERALFNGLLEVLD